MSVWAVGEPGQLVAQYDSSEPITLPEGRVAIEEPGPYPVGARRINDDGTATEPVADWRPTPDRWWDAPAA